MKTSRSTSATRATVAFTLVALGLLAACSGGEADGAGSALGGGGAAGSGSGTSTSPGDFESDSPTGVPGKTAGGSGSAGASSGGGGSSAGGAASAAPGKDGNEAAKAIEEADVIQVRGSKLYALSRYAGLAVVDISQKDNLKLLGKKRLSGLPFEMYVRDNVAYAMFTSWGEYKYEAGTDAYSWTQTSHIAAIDITDPANLRTIGEFDLPGDISDSRIVGDVLYAVSYENGYCWKCTNGNATTVTSLNVADPKSIGVVDTMSFTNPQNQYGGWGKRSITVTDKRIYVAGEEYGWDNGSGGAGNKQHGSTIQIVDIAAGTGKLAKGAAVPVKGMIESRWQMDEYAGTLRVISQPGWWSTSESPAMQTFKVVSSDEVTPLASVDLVMPKPNERLRSVRFDGARGYAITAEQKDPLFTLDFSDPTQPKQVGELELPGFVYHMEPRGDRVFALGFDNQQEGGSLHVSLFDVADFKNPKLLSRVPFGGTWSSLAEDQDRIQKAFNILPDDGLIMVPYSGYTYDTKNSYSCGKYESGIQLIDFTKDTLTKRGVAPQRGDARRAFLSDGRLFAVSDDAVRTFDITNRDAPAQTAQQLLANKVNRTVSAGDHIVRLSMDWYNSNVSLEVAPASNPDTPTPTGTIDLASKTEKEQGCYSSWGWSAQIFSVGSTVYLIGPSNDYYYYGGGQPNTSVRVVSVSIADPTKPTVLADTEIDLGTSLNEISWGYGYYGYYGYYGNGALVDTGAPSVQMGTTVAFRRQKLDYTSGYSNVLESGLEVFDLSDPKAPKHASSVKLPAGQGTTGLLANGQVVYTSHWENQPNGKVKFYVDRVDLTTPSAPKSLAKWNIPGSLAGFDPVSNQVITVDYQAESIPLEQSPNGYSYCQGYGGYGYASGSAEGGSGGDTTTPPEPNYEPVWGGWDGSPCVRTHRTFKLVSIDTNDKGKQTDTMPFPTSGYLDGLRLGDARLFTMLRSQSKGERAFTLGIGGAKLTSSEILVEEPNKTGGFYYWGSTYIADVSDHRALLSKYDYNAPKLYLLDTANVTAPKFDFVGELGSYLSEARIDGDKAVCSLDVYGVQVVSLKK